MKSRSGGKWGDEGVVDGTDGTAVGFLEDTGEDGSGGDWTSTACASCC